MDSSQRRAIALASAGLLVSVIIIVWRMRQISDPRTNALQAATCFLKGDWDKCYDTVAFGGENAAGKLSQGEFVGRMNSSITPEERNKRTAVYRAISDIKIETPKIQDYRAEVPVNYRFSVGAESIRMHGVLHMRRRSGIWRAESGSNSVETAQTWRDLIGKPERGSSLDEMFYPQK